jgi:hypothetical protein
MTVNHPFQNIYFNELIPKNEQYIRKNFEMDYWGTSYKQALEYILNRDKSNMITIMVANNPGRYNALILAPTERSRITFVDWKLENIKDVDYAISNYRYHPEDYNFLSKNKYFNIKVLNSDVISAWQIDHQK